jgi:ATP-binding cassette subfamily F protein 3
MASQNENVIKFESVAFEYVHPKIILDDVKFNVKTGNKITIMWQNGAWKSTIFKLINKTLTPKHGKVHTWDNTIATSFQVMPVEDKELSVQDFFRKYDKENTDFNMDKKIADILNVVNLKAPLDKKIWAFSWGQQARLLLASALIQNPDILLLDEPTNNLDTDWVYHLQDFLQNYKNTVLVISHDADFLNSFTDWVLYLDVNTKEVEQYVWDYYSVTEQISKRIEKENMKNERLKKEAQVKIDQANVFAHKWGKLRLVAKKMREAASEMKDEMVDVRKEDTPIKEFEIPFGENIWGDILKLNEVWVVIGQELVMKNVDKVLRKDTHMLLSAPNWMWKTTFLEKLAKNEAEWCEIAEGVKIGYYRQDFSNLDFESTVHDELRKYWPGLTEQDFRKQAARFQLDWEIMKSLVWDISEWQKGLVAFCSLVFLKPHLLILDEPTNHINFRHLPVIAEALTNFKGPMILVSHVNEFVWQVRIDDYLDLDKL